MASSDGLFVTRQGVFDTGLGNRFQELLERGAESVDDLLLSKERRRRARHAAEKRVRRSPAGEDGTASEASGTIQS